jgi:HSP20 family protein
MKVMRPLAPLGVTRRDFDTMFDRFFRTPLFPELLPVKTGETLWEPALDLSETEKEFIARLEVPGFHKENLDVKFEHELMTISGHREARNEYQGEDFLWTEREEGRFARTIRIPAPVDPARVEALYENGLLTVKLPKTEPILKAKIAIR